MFGCTSLSRLENRMAKLVAPNQLARSSGDNYATTDSYLSALELPHASKQVQLSVSNVPADEAMVFIAPDSTPETELVYRTISYLSWPRQVGVLHCAQNGAAPALLFKPREDKPVRWLLFYRHQVPAELSALPGIKEIGVHLKLVPARELKEWTFYCSQ